MKPLWLSRELIRCPVYFTLCTTPAMVAQEMKRMKVTDESKRPNVSGRADATCNFMENDKGEVVVIVCLFDHTKEYEQRMALLVHEAVHIWQEIRSIIGERHPSSEFEAYSIQHISQQLFYEYSRQMKRKK